MANVGGCLIEKKGRLYTLVYYMQEGVRHTQTKATGIGVADHKKREAERILKERINNKEQELLEVERIKSNHPIDVCMKKWVEYKATISSQQTAEHLASATKNIIEYFGSRKIMVEELKPKDVLAFYEWDLANGRRVFFRPDADKSLSRRTVNDHAAALKSFLNDAVLQEVITVNPAANVMVPKQKQRKTVEKVKSFDKEQLMLLLKFVKGDELFSPLYNMIKVCVCYGLRRSELLGLRWSVIDWEHELIEIKNTLIKTEADKGMKFVEDSTKTTNSHRFYPLLPEVKNILLELKEWQSEMGYYNEKDKNFDGFIFLNEEGRPYFPDYITKLFEKAVKRCPYDIPRTVTFHGLRHTCCAILFEEGWQLGEVQQWLGHKDIATTANIYNHVSKKWKNAHGTKANDIFGCI